MTRLNLSLRNDVARKLQERAESEGKLISSIASEALQMYFETKESGVETDMIPKISGILSIMDAMRAVPIPSMLLDQMLQLSVKNDSKTSLEIWEESGYAFSEICKLVAQDIESFGKFANLHREFIPADRFEVQINGDNATVLMMGAGYSLAASMCTYSGLVGLMRGYGMEVYEKTVERGLVKASFRKTKN
jgi:hypothetical protein